MVVNGALVIGYPLVLIGGFPMVNIPIGVAAAQQDCRLAGPEGQPGADRRTPAASCGHDQRPCIRSTAVRHLLSRQGQPQLVGDPVDTLNGAVFDGS